MQLEWLERVDTKLNDIRAEMESLEIEQNEQDKLLICAELKTIDKACAWLYERMYTQKDPASPGNHFVRSMQDRITQTEFVEQFKQSMISKL